MLVLIRPWQIALTRIWCFARSPAYPRCRAGDDGGLSREAHGFFSDDCDALSVTGTERLRHKWGWSPEFHPDVGCTRTQLCLHWLPCALPELLKVRQRLPLCGCSNLRRAQYVSIGATLDQPVAPLQFQ